MNKDLSPESALRSARLALERGDAQSAEASCRAGIARDPGATALWTLLGVTLRDRDPVAAERALRRALELDRRNLDALFHLGNLYRFRKHFAAAIQAYEQAAALAPEHPSVLNNLALALEADGKPERAQALYRAILRRQPEHRQAQRNLAQLLCRLRQFDEARLLCALYVQKFPDADADTWVAYGICLLHAGRNLEAETSLQRALALAPEDPLILTNLGEVMIARGDYARAAEILDQAVACDPPPLYALALLAHCRAHLCAWAELDALHARILHAIADRDELVNAFAVLAMPASAELQLRNAQRWARDLRSLAHSVSKPASRSRSGGRLRLGYVSSDFRTHPTAHLLTEVWERHDRARCETFAYSIGPREASPLRVRIEAAFDRFTDCNETAAEHIATRIRADEIDVLIDLNGYTTHARSEIFALRPAPVQVNWLGYLGTLGAEWYDYVITDRFATPQEQQQHFTERFLYLPHCYCPSDTRREVAACPPAREACGLPREGLVFCCFNNQYKILPRIFAVWMRLLAQVEGSVLWLSPAHPTATANLRAEAKAHGVAPERIVFAPRVAMPLHLARHVHADLFLDTSPYNAGATANDALLMSVPVLTCVGTTMASRVAGSQLHAIGLPELVTDSLADYERLALELARNPELLGRYRERLRANRASHPLFDMARFVAELEERLDSVTRA